jgi:cell wall-associated NlpC family hydrolase
MNIGRISSASLSEVDEWEPIMSLSDCKAGDLLFFKDDRRSSVSHVGVHIGGGQFIHAATSDGKVLISTFTSYYERNFVIARRIF